MKKEQLSNVFLDQSKELYWMVNQDFNLIFANKAYIGLLKEISGVEVKLNSSIFIEGFSEDYYSKWKAYYIRALKGEYLEIEEHFFNPKTAETQYGQTTFEPIRGDDNQIFAVACQSKNITRLVKRKSEANQLIDASLDVFCTINEKGDFVYVSAAATKLWGYLPEELIGKAYHDLIIEEDVTKSTIEAAAILSGQDTKSFVNRYKKKNGGVAYNHWSIRWDANTKLMYCVTRDAKEKIEQEEKLELSQKRYESLFKNSLDCVIIISPEGKTSYVSGSIINILGYSPSEAMNIDFKELIHPEDLEDSEKALERCINHPGISMKGHTARVKHKNGSWRWVEPVITNLLHDPSVKGIVDNFRDITSQKEEEEKLKLLESVVTHTNDAILITEAQAQDDSGPRIIYANEAFTKMTGYEVAEVIGKTTGFLHGANTSKEDIEKLRNALKNWESCEITTINYKKNGEEFWIDFTVTPVANEKGLFTHWITIQRDVTEQKTKELENELISKIGDIFNQSIDSDLKTCLDMLCKLIAKFGDFTFVEVWLPAIGSKTINLVTNYVESKAGGAFYLAAKNLDAFVLGEAISGYVWENSITEIWEEGDKEWRFFKRKAAAKKAGIKAMMGVPLKHREEVVGVLLMGTEKYKSNLTLLLKVFEKLESTIGSELNRKKIAVELAQIFDFSPDVICVADFDGYIKRINPAGLKLLGYTLEEMYSRPLKSFVHEEDQLLTIEKQRELYSSGNPQNFENRYVTKQGKLVWLSWTATSAPEHGVVYAVAKDITEEKKLRELNLQVGRLAKIGSWEVDVINQTVFWSEEVHQLYGTDPNTFVPNVESAINFYRDDFRQMAQSYFEKCISTREPYDIEAIIVTARNKEIWVRTTAKAEFVDDVCTRVYGSFQNIDERKKVEEERNSLLITIENSLNEIYIFDEETFKFTYVNKGALLNLGYSSSEIKTLTPLDLKPSYTAPTFKLLVSPLVNKEKEKIEFFTYHKRKNGSLYPVEVHLQLVSDGNTNRYLAIILDVTAHKKSEEDNRFKAKLLSTIGQAAIATNLDGVVKYWNKAAESIYGWTLEEAIGNNIMHLTTPQTNEAQAHQIMDKLRNGQRWSGKFKVRNKEGVIFTAKITNDPIFDENNNLSGIIGISSDITNEVKNEELIKQYTHELERSNEELEQFAFIASHDLQEPLRMIASFMDLLKRKYGGQLDEKGNQYIHYATDGAKRMKQIILDLLQYSRAKRLTEGKEKVNLNELLLEFQKLRRKLISEKSAKIINNNLPTLVTHKAAIVQIIHCLIDNALIYSRKNTPPIIEIGAEENEKEWRFSIKDNGVGIDSQFYDKIFIIFQRLQNKEKDSGTGIGLSIAKRHVELLGGRIWLESVPEEGTIFYFTILKTI